MSIPARRLFGALASRWVRPGTIDLLPVAPSGIASIESQFNTSGTMELLRHRDLPCHGDWRHRYTSQAALGSPAACRVSQCVQWRGFAGRPPSKNNEEPDKKANRINGEIQASVVRLVTDDGNEVIPLHEALSRAQENDMDLVEVAHGSGSDAPVVRIMDYARKQFEQRKKMKEHKKIKVVSRRLSVQKEVQLRPQIGDHDLDVKMAQAERHFEKGYKVRFLVNLRKPIEREAGQKVLDKVRERMLPLAKVLEQGNKKPHPVMMDILMMPLPETIKQPETQPETEQ